MDQKGLFDEQEGLPGGDEFGGLKEEAKEPGKKSNIKLLLGIGLLLVIGAYAANTFLLKKGEEAVAPSPPKRIPIKEVPIMAAITGAKAAPAPAKEVAKAEVKKGKPKAKKPAEVKVAKKEEKAAPKKARAEGYTVIIGRYAAKYELEAARERLKGIRYASREAKKKVLMNRLLVREVKDKGEAAGLLSELKEKGYDPFTVSVNGAYKVYAVSNLSEDISEVNRQDLERLGYSPVVEKKETLVKVHELVASAKSREDAESLSEKLRKMGFKPEMDDI